MFVYTRTTIYGRRDREDPLPIPPGGEDPPPPVKEPPGKPVDEPSPAEEPDRRDGTWL